MRQGANEDGQQGRRRFADKWRKVATSKCNVLYPDHLQFNERGNYFGQRGPDGADFTIWDAGTYQVVYEFSLSGKVLTFVDQHDCTFHYERIEDPIRSQPGG